MIMVVSARFLIRIIINHPKLNLSFPLSLGTLGKLAHDFQWADDKHKEIPIAATESEDEHDEDDE